VSTGHRIWIVFCRIAFLAFRARGEIRSLGEGVLRTNVGVCVFEIGQTLHPVGEGSSTPMSVCSTHQ
jgi:hypothetical protein